LNSGVHAGQYSNSAISIDEMIAPALAILLIANSRFLAILVETASLNSATACNLTDHAPIRNLCA
jgi:hypothetical protein